MTTTSIVEKLKTLREQTGVSQEDVANYIGISRLTYITIENGKREIKDNEIRKVADFFEKPLSYFIEKASTLNKDDKHYKLKQLILYISEKSKDIPSFGKTVLNKLLYFSDFDYYEWTNTLITGSEYKKLPFGPAPADIADVLDEMVKDGLIAITETTFHNYTQQKIIPLMSADMSFLDEIDEKSKAETEFEDLPKSIEIIENVLNKFKHHKASEISERSHLDTPYKASKNIGDVIRPGLVFYRSESFIVNPHNL